MTNSHNSLRNRIRRIRKSIASVILGDQLALFMPKVDCDRAKADLFEQMDDATLAAYTRWFLSFMRPIYERNAAAEGVGVGTYSNIHSVLNLVRTARLSNAGEMTLVQSCTIAGEDAGIWKMTLKELKRYDFGKPGVRETWDGDKLVKLDVSHDFRDKGGGGV